LFIIIIIIITILILHLVPAFIVPSILLYFILFTILVFQLLPQLLYRSFQHYPSFLYGVIVPSLYVSSGFVNASFLQVWSSSVLSRCLSHLTLVALIF